MLAHMLYFFCKSMHFFDALSSVSPLHISEMHANHTLLFPPQMIYKMHFKTNPFAIKYPLEPQGKYFRCQFSDPDGISIFMTIKHTCIHACMFSIQLPEATPSTPAANLPETFSSLLFLCMIVIFYFFSRKEDCCKIPDALFRSIYSSQVR